MGFFIKRYLTKINFESFKSIFLQTYDPFSPGNYPLEINEKYNYMELDAIYNYLNRPFSFIYFILKFIRISNKF